MLKLQGKIQTDAAFLRDFNGQAVKLYRNKDNHEPSIGQSGETAQYLLTSGGALYLTQDQVQD